MINYCSEDEYNKAFEDDFRSKVEEVAYYQGSRERVTLDNEWTESELREDLEDEVGKVLEQWLAKHKSRAVYDKDLTYESYVVEKLVSENDLIEIYNKAYDKHRNDTPMKFGIVYYDEAIEKLVTKILNDNLITK